MLRTEFVSCRWIALGVVLASTGCSGGDSGGFGGLSDSNRGSGQFGAALTSLGDLDNDGFDDLAVGVPGANGRSKDQGAVNVLFLRGDASFAVEKRIRSGESGFTGDLDAYDSFGAAVTSLGDLDNDGIIDLACGAPDDDDSVSGGGAVWMLFLLADGTVKATRKVSSLEGGFAGVLSSNDNFGFALALLGDLNGGGAPELAVGAPSDDDSGKARGAVWILSLTTDGAVTETRKISVLEGGFAGPLGNGDRFGSALAALGDLDLDGVPDLAVGAPFDADDGYGSGAVWILFLNADGTVKTQRKISADQGGLTSRIRGRDEFGSSITLLGDLDTNGSIEVAVGAPGDDRNLDRGAVYILSLSSTGDVTGDFKIATGLAGFVPKLNPLDRFGSSVAAAGDVDRDGILDLAAGAVGTGPGGQNEGEVSVLFLRTDARVRDTRTVRERS